MLFYIKTFLLNYLEEKEIKTLLNGNNISHKLVVSEIGGLPAIYLHAKKIVDYIFQKQNWLEDCLVIPYEPAMFKLKFCLNEKKDKAFSIFPMLSLFTESIEQGIKFTNEPGILDLGVYTQDLPIDSIILEHLSKVAIEKVKSIIKGETNVSEPRHNI